MQFAPLYPLAYRLLKPLFPDCLWSGEALGVKGEGKELRSPQMALTFDDGPHIQYTPQLLEVLDKYHVPASFFWLGVCVERAPNVAKAVYDQGHWIGLHGYTHREFVRLSASQLKQSLEKTQATIAQACNLDLKIVQQQMRDVRPPNGLFAPHTLALLQQWGYRPVMWSVLPEDWVRPGVAIVIQRVMQQIQNGSLLVLHDGYYGGADVAETTSQLIPLLIEQGYQFVTVNQLWQSKQVKSA